jgi:hydrophobe/amphiphile efflux-1 (HAE1) family protein
MGLSELAIRRPVFAWMIMAALITFGALSFKQLGISQLPDVDFPVVGVSVSLPGAAPEVIESQVVDLLEDSLMQIGGIRSISSSSQQSSGSISVEFELDRNIDEAVQEVQGHIAQTLNLLPKDLLPPTVKKSNPEDQPIMWIAVAGDGSVPKAESMIYARNYLYDQFATIPGVGDIALGGYVDPALRVWLSLDKLKDNYLTADDVVQAIKAEHVEMPAGRLENSKHEYNVRIKGEALNPTEFGKIRVNSRVGLGANFKPLPLSAVAKIEEGTVDIRRISRFNGQPAVGLGILKQHGSNAVEVAERIRQKLKEIEPTIPKSFKLSIRSDSTVFIKQSVDELNFMLILSALLTSAVCLFFLGSWTSTMNVLLAIPTSIIGTFMAIYFLGFTLNTFTLLGLSLAIGVVVDDAIMMLENIVRHRELGEKKREAALKGSSEITFAAIAATIAVIAIFLPVVFMKGVVGKFLYQYGVTVSAAVLLSLLEALTLTPMRCSQYLKVSHKPNGFAARVDSSFKKLAFNYQKVLTVLLRHRWKTVFGALVFFLSSLLIAKFLPSEMVPAQDQSRMLIRFKGPVGSALALTNESFKIGEEYLSHVPEVEGYFSIIGGFGGDAVNQGIMFVTLVDAKARKLTQGELIIKIRKELKAKLKSKKMEIVAQDLSLRGFTSSRGFPVEFIIQGPNWDRLTEYTFKIIEAFKKKGFVTDVNTDVQTGMPEVKIIPNREKLSRRGVALNSVTTAVSALFGGAILNGQTEYQKSGHRYSIEVRLAAEERNKVAQLKEVLVRNNRGNLIPLSELVDLEEKPSLMLISRLNRARAIKVFANPAPGVSQQTALKEAETLAKSMLPPGYFLKLTGSAESFKESFQSLLIAMLLGIVVSYMVLASQFNSFLHPIIVLIALPFSISGGFMSLALFHQSINIYSMIGFILLMGIVKKNSILLVDFTNQCRAEGDDIHSALLRACPVRLRPIVMTSLATVAGALPEALSIGPGAETTIPMAIAIIGGIIASTILTLFVVPCAYSLMARLERPDPLDLDQIKRPSAVSA